MKNKIALILVLLFALLQIIPNEKVAIQEVTEADLFQQEAAEDDLIELVKKNCYDCHSNQVKYPWYSSIAPVSWWIQDHIDHGRGELNFSNWAEYPAGKKAHKAEEVVELVEEGEMPLKSYTFIHRHAKLSKEEKEIITDWFTKLDSRYNQ